MKCGEEEKKDEETHSLSNQGGGEGRPRSLIVLGSLVKRLDVRTMSTVEDRDCSFRQ